MTEIMEYRDYRLGNTVKLLVDVFDENDNIVPAGTVLRLVAIAPKVRIVKGIDNDNLPYFYNAVIASQESDYVNRIRADFCTIEKVKFFILDDHRKA